MFCSMLIRSVIMPLRIYFAEAAKFDKATYMTATPIEQKYVLEELKHLPVCEIN